MVDENLLKKHGMPLSRYLLMHESPHTAIIITDSSIKVVEDTQGIITEHGDHSGE